MEPNINNMNNVGSHQQDVYNNNNGDGSSSSSTSTSTTPINNSGSKASSATTEEDYILSIDVGTTNIRAIIFDKQLNIIAKSIENIPLIIDQNRPGARLAWVLENIEEARVAAKEKNMLFGTIDTWLLWNLTGGKAHCTDYSNISTTSLYDPYEMKFNSVIQYLFNIPQHIMPKVCDTAFHYGDTLPELFGRAIPITAMAGDQQSAMFGQCCFKTGDTKVTIGTGCFVDINTGRQARASRTGMYPLIGWKIKDDIAYLMEGKGMAAGTAVDWACQFGMFEHVAQTSGLASSVPHSQGVVFVPAFTGLAPPQNDPTARGLLIGMTPSTKREHVVRALLEALGYRAKEIIDGLVLDNHTTISKIVADGGVCQNDFVMQFSADMVGRPIDRADQHEMTAAGACMLAGLGHGLWKTKEELIPLRKTSRLFESRMNKDNRKKLFRRWQRAVQRSMHWASSEDVHGDNDDGFGQDSDLDTSTSQHSSTGSYNGVLNSASTSSISSLDNENKK
ncbi:hypothetical protein DFA_05322 [Cavenderia fasciculata]|uniref:glycerol kinase n=1 Tax=Cavenderia fasciculata TaxID=261658 RepID=F4PKW8_CACFS|nr:uncharacterized protein DFA_05322 [Cavenderia fasciculata]EGG23190.1 hypothetical protein DFA_05322 [Cavenderia fasciculata]|eukprot:XP_004361041.1 hypothetical protein DFA_05322 [Cavenderia fasciculata]